MYSAPMRRDDRHARRRRRDGDEAGAGPQRRRWPPGAPRRSCPASRRRPARGRSRPCASPARAARIERAHRSRVSSSIRGPSSSSMTLGGNADVGDRRGRRRALRPAAAPAAASARASVTVIVASMAGPAIVGAVGRQAARQIDRRRPGTPDALTSATTVSTQPGQRRREAGAEDRVDDQVARRARRVPCSSQAGASAISTTSRPSRREDVEVRPRVAPDVGRRCPSRNTPTSTPRCAASAPRRSRRRRCCRGRTARRPRIDARSVERRLHRRHDLPAGVLHQHDRRDADVVDRAPIGLAHLLAVEHSHRRVA